MQSCKCLRSHRENGIKGRLRPNIKAFAFNQMDTAQSFYIVMFGVHRNVPCFK